MTPPAIATAIASATAAAIGECHAGTMAALVVRTCSSWSTPGWAAVSATATGTHFPLITGDLPPQRPSLPHIVVSSMGEGGTSATPGDLH